MVLVLVLVVVVVVVLALALARCWVDQERRPVNTARLLSFTSRLR